MSDIGITINFVP